jgi:cytochrome c oxidase cbb3-type subunit 3
MVIGGIILVVALMVGTYFVAGDAFQSDDYINTLTMIGAFAIVAITVATALKYINQIKNDTATGELAEENWDGIGEFTNPIPSGWGLIFIGTIIWMLWYFFIGYPTNQFSQIGQYNEEVLENNAKFAKAWKNPTPETLVAMGESTFLVQCAPCHGVDAEGIDTIDAAYSGIEGYILDLDFSSLITDSTYNFTSNDFPDDWNDSDESVTNDTEYLEVVLNILLLVLVDGNL